jgi:hypothetical protein
MELARCGGGGSDAKQALSTLRLKVVDFQGSSVTSDGGLLLVRELPERLGLGALIERRLTGARDTAERVAYIAKVIPIARASASAICK